MLHFAIAVAGFDNMQVEHIQVPPPPPPPPPELVGFFIPAAPQSNAFIGGGTSFGASALLFSAAKSKSKEGREDSGTDLACSSALRCDGMLASVNVVMTEKTNVGSASFGSASAASFEDFLGTRGLTSCSPTFSTALRAGGGGTSDRLVTGTGAGAGADEALPGSG